MQLALELAGVIERNATNDSLKELASAVQLVLAAPAEMLSEHRLGRIEQLIHENSGNCCFRQRGYNWHFDDGVWIVARCESCKKFDTWPAALHAAMRDEEFRLLRPEK
jgi:hypothetical protein